MISDISQKPIRSYLAMRYPVDAEESFEEDIVSNNNILDIVAKNPTTDKNLSIKDEKKEKLKIVEGDAIQGVSYWNGGN